LRPSERSAARGFEHFAKVAPEFPRAIEESASSFGFNVEEWIEIEVSGVKTAFKARRLLLAP
jgi:hypothetical protein